MGIDVSGGMLVGCSGSELVDLKIPEEFDESLTEWLCESENMDSYCEYYDAGYDRTYYGFSVEDLLVEDINEEWVSSIKDLAEQFERVTGVKAKLIGTQDVY